MNYKSSILLSLALPVSLVLMSGCANTHVENTSPSTQTQVSLTHANYKVIKAGAMGRSYGFRFLLGIIPISSPTTAEARADLYQNLGEPVNGKSVALINVMEDRSTTWLLLFSIPKRTVTGDVVEFADNTAAAPVTGDSTTSAGLIPASATK